MSPISPPVIFLDRQGPRLSRDHWAHFSATTMGVCVLHVLFFLDKWQCLAPWQPFSAMTLTSVLHLPVGLSFTPRLFYRRVLVRGCMRRPVLGILLSSVPLLVGLYYINPSGLVHSQSEDSDPLGFLCVEKTKPKIPRPVSSHSPPHYLFFPPPCPSATVLGRVIDFP